MLPGFITYEPGIGMHINRAIEEALDRAKANDSMVRMEFNEIVVWINPTDTLEGKVNEWQAESDRRYEAYLASPEYKKQQEEIEQEKLMQKALLQKCKDEQPDFTDLRAVIDWLDQVRKCDMIAVSKDGIIEMLESHGFESNVNCGDAFKGDDKENFGRWLIGQAMSCIETFGGIHPMYEVHAEAWRVRFEVEK